MKTRCPTCGKRNDGAFCIICGTPSPTTPTPDDATVKRNIIVWFRSLDIPRKVCVIGGLTLVFLLFILFMVPVHTPPSVTESAPRDNPQPAKEESVEPAPSVPNAVPSINPYPDETLSPPTEAVKPRLERAIGEDFSVGYWSYRCNRAMWQPYIVSGFETLERSDAEFLIVDLVVINNDRTSSTLPPFKLVDAQGREFDESSKGMFLDGAFETLKQLNPGVSSRGLVVFDVPHGEYGLKVSGGFESGENALIDLSSDRKQESGQESPQAPPPPETPVPDDQSAH